MVSNSYLSPQSSDINAFIESPYFGIAIKFPKIYKNIPLFFTGVESVKSIVLFEEDFHLIKHHTPTIKEMIVMGIL